MAVFKKIKQHLLSGLSMAGPVVMLCIHHSNSYGVDNVLSPQHHCTEDETISLCKFVQLLNDRPKTDPCEPKPVNSPFSYAASL